MVIYGHMAPLTGSQSPLFFGEAVSTIGVKIFFVLSGYLITQSFLRDENFLRYYMRRIIRIIPGLVFVVLITVFIIGPLISTQSSAQYFTDPNTYRYLHNMFLKPVYTLPGVFVDNYAPYTVNGSLWTLPVEFLMYILVPFAVLFFRKIKFLKPGLAIVGILLLVIEILRVNFFVDASFVVWGTNLFDCFVLSPYFFIGAFFSFPEFQKFIKTQVGFALLFILAILTLNNYSQYEPILFLTLPYITLSFCFAPQAICGRIFAVNDYSYGLYLWGYITQQVFISIIGISAMPILLYAFVCFTVAFLCAIASWHLVEKPCSRIAKKLILMSKKREQLKKCPDKS